MQTQLMPYITTSMYRSDSCDMECRTMLPRLISLSLLINSTAPFQPRKSDYMRLNKFCVNVFFKNLNNKYLKLFANFVTSLSNMGRIT